MRRTRPDLAIQNEEQVAFKLAWADLDSGTVFWLSQGPSAEAVQRITSVPDTRPTGCTRCPSKRDAPPANGTPARRVSAGLHVGQLELGRGADANGSAAPR